ncbi:metallophosphoesterase [Lichenihabitans sp. Uapishka_5]|uniref:metallophosphoesterase family protein n=1 Tax=Lichenihabitans sp. Uapishka_5 TaxID=3037302 RepID=UPI0029E81383|nr:metallophosphoesterase [Lichenihabitans sp. Uapishka_5]MDX7950576.1 metallophosphoesterase [Lichenihabitans sp. Uapishka_5]
MTFLLAHLSDAHIGPLPTPRYRDLLGKRLTGYINWNRRSKLHDMAVLARLVDDMRAQNPDHTAMTGDILNIGLTAEFPFARDWLAGLGPTHDVSFVPGNHDAYTRSSAKHISATFAPWTSDQAPGPAREVAFPYWRRRGDVALIGLSSAIPTAPFLASGALGHEQRDAFAALLDDAARQGLAAVVMVHHPPNEDGASTGRGLRDARKFEDIIAHHGAELVIHGHNHRSSVALLEGPRGPVPVVGVESCSAVPGTPGHRAAYHLFRLDRQGAGWTIEGQKRSFDPVSGGFSVEAKLDLSRSH